MAVNRQSGVRKYQRRTVWQRANQWWTCRRVASIGRDVYVEPNVQIMRHPEKIYLADNVVLKSSARLCPTNPDAEIRIGNWTTVGYNTYMFATTSIHIGNNCLIAPFCYLVDANHGIRRHCLIREQDMSAAPITIEDDVWLGTGAVILKGVTVGQGAVISAGAVVSRDVSPYSIMAGNPAKVINERH